MNSLRSDAAVGFRGAAVSGAVEKAVKPQRKSLTRYRAGCRYGDRCVMLNAPLLGQGIGKVLRDEALQIVKPYLWESPVTLVRNTHQQPKRLALARSIKLEKDKWLNT